MSAGSFEKLTAGEASQKLALNLIGSPDFLIDGVADPVTATAHKACFLEASKYVPAFRQSLGQCWLTTQALYESLDQQFKHSRVFLISERPYLSFVQLTELFFPAPKARGRVSPQASVDPTAKVHASAQIEALVSIGANAEIGANCILHPGVWIGAGSKIGEESILYSGVKVYPNCLVGRRNILHSGCVIGSDGFGFLPTKQGLVKIPQVGRAILHDDVEIGANSTIDRGTLDDTVIGQGSKIDNLVQVGHNCKLGKNTILCAFVGLSGNTTLGDNVMMAGQAASKGHLKIGDNAQIAARTGVSKDLAPGSVVKGYPPTPISEYLKIQALVQRLPEIYKRLVKIEDTVQDISESIEG